MEENEELNAASAVLPLGLRHRCMEKFLRDRVDDGVDYWNKPQCIVFPHLYLNQRAEAAECQICKQRVSLHAILTHAPHRDLLRPDLTPEELEEACTSFGRSHMTRWCQNWRKCLLLQNPRPTDVEKRAYAFLKEKFHRARMSRRKRKSSESAIAAGGETNGVREANAISSCSPATGVPAGDGASSSNSKEDEDGRCSGGVVISSNGEYDVQGGDSEDHDRLHRQPKSGINAVLAPLLAHLHSASDELNHRDDEQVWFQHQLDHQQKLVEGLQAENIYLRRENSCLRFQLAECQRDEARSELEDAKMRIMELAEDTKRVCEERDKLKGIVQAMKVLVKDNAEVNGFSLSHH